MKYAYIVDFVFILFIYLSIYNTGKIGEKLFRKHIKRVVNRLFYNYIFICGCFKAKEVFYDDKVRGLYVFNEN
jgi:hypothetical protein